MKEKRIVKFNLYMSFILLALCVVMLIATTVAYFTDTKTVNNTLTTGNVRISLSEAAVKKDQHGNLVEDPSAPRIFGAADAVINDYGKVYSGQSIYKDPTITNTGSNDAWVAAKITVDDGRGDLTKIMGYEGYQDIDIQMLLSGGLFAEDKNDKIHFGTWNGIENVYHCNRFALIQEPDPANDKFEFYFIILAPLKSGEEVTIFDHVTFDESWDGSDMQNFIDLELNVQAYAVQTFDLDSCFEAMTLAFPDHFKFN
ncbi:MAG: SipW-dependent-type signal peptide-containing protein [Clostridia bacterium]|nr:SipW-dependent-type signal peptide-containing protein [Clostridia bacterium]